MTSKTKAILYFILMLAFTVGLMAGLCFEHYVIGWLCLVGLFWSAMQHTHHTYIARIDSKKKEETHILHNIQN